MVEQYIDGFSIVRPPYALPEGSAHVQYVDAAFSSFLVERLWYRVGDHEFFDGECD